MTPERRRQINALFRATQERPPVDRAAFLTDACAGDEELRRYVEAMLGEDQPNPLATSTNALKDDSPPEFSAEQTIRDYRIVRELGRGGMGDVYLAEDTRLGRRVALKLLPAHFTQDPERVHRFQREARAASALNHPNIVTIYDFGQQDNRHFIAAEFVEGRTLRAAFKQRDLTLGQSLDVAAQAASALAAAHQAGIIHRDIKPENVMLRPDGYVKVLDFGLAKLTDSGMATRAPGAEAESFQTMPGRVMGTTAYMSPEQARGLEVDERADIFSLGVVLYEMITGRRPFEGMTPVDVMASLLDSEPEPLSTHMPDAPPELQRVVSRMLAKAREDRYQTAGELLMDLKALKEDLALEAQLGRIRTSGSGEAIQSATTNVGSVGRTSRAGQTTDKGGAEIGGSQNVRRRRGFAIVGVVVAVVVLAVGLVVWRGWSTAKSPAFDQLRMTKFTATGSTRGGCISPDGKYVAYLAAEPAGTGVWVKQVVGGGQTRILPPEAKARALAFAPDGNLIYYTAEESNQPGSLALYQVPVLGGLTRKVLNKAYGIGAGSIAPDGKRIAFARQNELIIANLDGSVELSFAAASQASELRGSAWSQDGKMIAYVVRDRSNPDAVSSYVAVKQIAGGAEQVLTRRRESIRGIAWLPPGQGLLMVAVDDTLLTSQLYHLSYPDGSLRNITRDINDYDGMSATADGSAILMSQHDRPASVWIAPLSDLRQARQITPGTSGYDSVAWTPDGKLVYSHEVNGRDDLWLSAADGGQPRQLTAEAGNNYYPAVSPDGRYIVFISNRSGGAYLWRMELDGNSPVQLTNATATQPQFSPDGQWVVYKSTAAGSGRLWKVALQGGTPVQLTEHEADKAAISPDGRWLAYQQTDQGTRQTRIAVRPFAGGEMVKTFEARASTGLIRWMANSRSLAYIADGKEIKLQPLSGGAAQTLLSLPADSFFWFDFSRDGNSLAYTIGRRTQDLILINNLR
jgi:serine/threonine protein kinase/Tol biopolymer transport system component